MRTGHFAVMAGIVVLGCAGRGPQTLRGWEITETRMESLGRMAGLLYADHVREKHGLGSARGRFLARVGKELNECARILALGEVPPSENWSVVETFLDEVLTLSMERELLLAEGIAMVNELATQMEGNQRARLWPALFFQSASHAILEVYENEFIDGTDSGHSAGDSLGDSGTRWPLR